MIIRKHLLGLALAAATTMAAHAALAADFEPPVFVQEAPAEEYVPVEVGSGWYLRGDVSYIANKPYRDRFSGAIPLNTLDEKFTPATVSIGMGYHLNDYFRTELNFATMPKYEAGFSRVLGIGGALERVQGGATEGYGFTGMASAFVDLGTFVGVTPYIGGGLGLAYHRVEASEYLNYADPALTDRAASYQDKNYTFAYSLGAGVQYKVSKNVALDLGYQFFSAPEAKRAVLTDTGYTIAKGIDYHQVKLGVRYDLW